MGKGTRRGQGVLEEQGNPWILAQAVLTSHLDSEAEAGGAWGLPGLAGVQASVGWLCSPDAEDAAGAFDVELHSLLLLHRLPVVAPEDEGTSPGKLTAQHHRVPRGHTEWAGGCLWGKELDWGLWTERGGVSLGLLPPSPPALAGGTHQPG